MKPNKQDFDVLNVKLTGSNLVEASAGTGKTYSIAILVLRMIIEQGISIEKQLIVTYTNFAVAELKDRVRKFLNEAHEYVQDIGVNDKYDSTITTLCDNVSDKSLLKERLKSSLLSMDEAAIYTIHGFCQRILSEFAFETKQNFKAELINDVSNLIQLTSNEFWRKELSILPEDIFSSKELLNIKEEVEKLLAKGLGNVFFKDIFEDSASFDQKIGEWSNIAVGLQDEITALNEVITNNFLQDSSLILNEYNSIKSIRKISVANSDFIEKVKNKVIEKIDSPEIFEGFTSPVWQNLIILEQKVESKEIAKANLMYFLFEKCSVVYLPMLKDSIEKANVLTFDSLILNLYQAVVIENNLKLIDLIRKKFEVVFIDEFQDTDLIQFKLFDKLFITKDKTFQCVTFLIGDPKQSIYSFRNANVESYLSAAESIDYQYSMDVNYRSTQSMVNAANTFFLASAENAFGYEVTDSKKIVYQEVKAFHQEKKIYKDQTVLNDSLFFQESPNNDSTKEELMNMIIHLLNPENKYTINDGNGLLRPISAADIAVLTYSNGDGLMIKNELIKANIPAVLIHDSTVLKSQEAKEMALILQAMIRPDLVSVKSALYLTFIQSTYTLKNNAVLPILEIDEVECIERFSNYRKILFEQDAFQAFSKLFNDFSINQLFSTTPSTQRILANVLQLSELIQRQQYYQNMSPEELLLWLKSAHSESNGNADEEILRIESDKNSVNILTLHKSKGLEFPIVLVYNLIKKKTKNNENTLVQITNEIGDKELLFQSKYILKDFPQLELSVNESERRERQESHRIIYVAITRAVYQCYFFYSKSLVSGTVLSELLQPDMDGEGVCRNVEIPKDSFQFKNYTDTKVLIPNVDISYKSLEKSRSLWDLHSYSSLAITHEYMSKPVNIELGDYDKFIYNQLPRGADAGTRIHSLLENIQFNKDYRELDNLSSYDLSLLQLFNKNDGSQLIDLTAGIAEMIHHILYSKILIKELSFSLNEIGEEYRLHELEFNLPVNQTHLQKNIIPLLRQYNTGIQDKYMYLQGIMTGVIDLIFQYEGKYYILDWKSNYLGYKLDDYQGENLNYSMAENQYILQYLIYTVAVHKYLKQRLGDRYDYDTHFGGVIYFFIRGVRMNLSSGIFTDRPQKDYILELERALQDNPDSMW
jgi:exodeoxyribonuclease V beta subunit